MLGVNSDDQNLDFQRDVLNKVNSVKERKENAE